MHNYMKLDMKFVQGVSDDPTKQAAAKKFLLAALQIGAIPLAEGIEKWADFEWLKEVGYELFQGYLFGKPGRIPAILLRCRLMRDRKPPLYNVNNPTLYNTPKSLYLHKDS